jgi:hypothetical protein
MPQRSAERVRTNAPQREMNAAWRIMSRVFLKFSDPNTVASMAERSPVICQPVGGMEPSQSGIPEASEDLLNRMVKMFIQCNTLDVQLTEKYIQKYVKMMEFHIAVIEYK